MAEKNLEEQLQAIIEKEKASEIISADSDDFPFSYGGDAQISRERFIIEQKIKAIDQQIFQDEVRLANKMQGRGTEATQAYCPVFQDTRQRNYCEQANVGKPCASYDKCYK